MGHALNFFSVSSSLLNRRPADLQQNGRVTGFLIPLLRGNPEDTGNDTGNRFDVVHDLIGIGFRPSNLALAIALEESGQVHGPLDVLFLDKQSDYRWHGNTLVTQSELQISFLKDLVTLRNPISPYSFVNYLKAHDRLVDFISLGTFYPCRMEFNDYLRWVASHFEAQSRYGEEVLAIEPVLHQQQVEALRVISRDSRGQRHVRHDALRGCQRGWYAAHSGRFQGVERRCAGVSSLPVP